MGKITAVKKTKNLIKVILDSTDPSKIFIHQC